MILVQSSTLSIDSSVLNTNVQTVISSQLNSNVTVDSCNCYPNSKDSKSVLLVVDSGNLTNIQNSNFTNFGSTAIQVFGSPLKI